ncbi:histone acetyltransferase GCN5 [Candidatus Scalindua japonica]|uniref:Histone acetyltransferase GCN5 n=1 Tax=Candidatus Scalindua japonica TaxID=1284222 RepID=A0A286TYB1_9BACT|nr:hypothetical protein [Candidatus Scalindua japonica]GAX60801.1 histone acetyltransferase GCN5 [Candidatus Scalindua japonica]
MKNVWFVLSLISTLVIIQNCTTTTEKVVLDNKASVDQELFKDLQAIKSELGYVPEDGAAPDTKTVNQPLEFGVSVSAVQKKFPAPDKFEFEPMVNNNVTMLVRNSVGGRFTFFFYENKLYKIIILSSWNDYTLQFAADDIKNTEAIFIEGNGEPDVVEEDEMHKKMVWIKEDMEVKLESFNLMSHKGMSRIMSLMYTNRKISQLAKKDESFELYKTKRKGIQDH